MSKPKIHIFTGAKGGIGKTLLSLSMSVIHLNLGLMPLIVDFNIFNPDCYDILSKLKDDSKKLFTREKRFKFTPLSHGYLVTLSNSHTSNYCLPQNGIKSFYNDINRVIEIAREENIPTKLVLIDTGFHIANLAIPFNQHSNHPWLKDDPAKSTINHLADYELFIWFIWTLAALSRKPEIRAIQNVSRKLNKYDIGDFDDISNIYHVLNPFNLITQKSMMDKLNFRFFSSSDDFEKLIKAESANTSMNINIMLKDVHRKVKSLEGSRLKHHTYSREIANVILEIFNKRRPKNLYPIPYDSELKGYTDIMALKNINSTKILVEKLGKPYQKIHDYFGTII